MKKTTPIDPPASDTASVATSVALSESRQQKKNQMQTLLTKGGQESGLRYYLRRACCSIGSASMLFIVIFALTIALFAWLLSFISGYISTMSAISSVKDLVRSQALSSLEDKLSEPAELLLRQYTNFKTFQVELSRNSTSRINLHQNILETIVQYRESLGADMYYAAYDDFFGWFTLSPEKDSIGNSIGYNHKDGTRKRYSTVYDMDLNVIEPEVVADFDFYPTTRPWYKQSVQRRSPGISDVYLFINAEEKHLSSPGITYTIPYINDTGMAEVVFALDYNLDDMYTLLSDIRVGLSGSVFMAEPNGLLLASSEKITFTTADGDRLKASESPDATQRTAARIIEERVGFDKVPDGYSVTYSSGQYVLEVFYVRPSLKTTLQPLLDDPWVLVLIYPIFQDYTQPILWWNLGSVLVTLLLVLMSCMVAVGFLLFVFILPLRSLMAEMQKIQSMQLDSINEKRLATLYEIRQIQSVFYKTVGFLKLYRSFLPSYLVANESSQVVGDDVSETRSKASGSIGSQKTGIHSSHSTGLNQRAMEKLRRFDVGMESGEGIAVCVYFIHAQELISLNSTEFIEQHSRMVSVIEKVFKLHDGMLDRFSEYKCVGNFFDTKKATNAAMTLRKRLTHCVGQLKVQYAHHLDFSIGVSYGEVQIAVLGNDRLKSKRVFGPAVDKSVALSELGPEWPCKIFLDKDTVKRIDKKKWISRPVATIVPEQGPVYELMGSSQVADNEWLYEKRDSDRNNAVALYSKAFAYMEKEQHEKAIEHFESFLDIHENDELTLRHLKSLKVMVDE